MRDHPFPLSTADALHRNGALSEQDRPFYEAKSALLLLLGHDSVEAALFEEGCQCVVPQGSCCWMAAPNRAKLSPSLCFPEWLLHGQKKLGLEAHPSGDWHPAPCLGISGKPSSPLSHLVVPSLPIEQNISPKKQNQHLINVKTVVSASSRPTTTKASVLLVGYQSNRSSGLEMADKIKRWVPT